MPVSTFSLLFPIAALLGASGVVALERRCIAKIRATVTKSPGYDDTSDPDETSVEFNIEGRGTARTAYLARRDAEKGLTKCIKNYFETDRDGSGDGGEGGGNLYDNSWGYLEQCNAHDECAKHVNPYNEPLEDIIIKKLFNDELGCSSRMQCRWASDVRIKYLKVYSPDGGSGCFLPPRFEFTDYVKNAMCPGSYGVDGCSSKYHDFCP